MSEENTTDISDEDVLADLKQRATTLGVTFHPSIGLEKLREKVSKAMEDKSSDAEEDVSSTSNEPAKAVNAVSTKEAADNAKKLIRVRVTCMDPSKKEYDGEILTAGNSSIGTIKKYIPYGIEWHVPQILLNQLRDRKYQTFFNEKDEHGRTHRRGKLVNAYAIEVLPPLTKQELKELEQRQAMAAGKVV